MNTRYVSLTLASLVVGLPTFACAPTPQNVTLRSLEGAGHVSFVCLGTKLDAAQTERLVIGPRSLDDCPDLSPVDGEERHLYSLVTQPRRGEIAVVDLTGGAVVDTEPSVLGFNFLPVGAQPTSVVSTPGSVASFVGVGEVGREGIFALPWAGLVGRNRDSKEPIRDLTSWSACRLPSAPGDMAVLVDEQYDRDGDPSTPDVSSCGEGDVVQSTLTQLTRTWPADLSVETVRPGRRKLAVALPDRGEIVILDAQALLDRPPGSYEPCAVERRVRLAVDLPKTPIAQRLPPDLAGSVQPPGLVHGPVTDPRGPRPAGFAQVDDPLSQEHRLFVADLDAPVVHVLDTAHPCDMREAPPLLPVSFVDPARVVTTSRVAASPLTTDQKRYLYAIDEGLGGGSVMIFDISPGSSDRTPILRPRSDLLPFEPPDRIAFDAPARDVAFARRDHVHADSTGSQREGVLCDPIPYPGKLPDPAPSPGALYRTSADFTTGAGPGNLRGVFGFIALESGQVSVIDVQDYDAPCRRPISVNSSSQEDFRGCAGDPSDVPKYRGTPEFTNSDGTATVSGEASCRIVEPNRSRSSQFMRNDDTLGVRAPALRAMPKLVSDSGRTLLTDRTEEGLKNPRMLGVNFSATDRARVYIGSTLFDTESVDSKLKIDPAEAETSSLVLSFAEPRAYAPQEDFAAVFEGAIVGERTGARFAVAAGGAVTLTDSGMSFCDHGVEDRRIARVRAAALGVPDQSLSQYAQRHADYAVITSELLDPSDSWWRGAEGSRCGGADPRQPGAGFLTCQSNLGTRDAPADLRELRVLEASANTLTVEPRLLHASPANRGRVSDLLACCFPQLVSYEVRASAEWVVHGSFSGFRHDVVTDSSAQCAIDGSPLRAHLRSRAIEMSCRAGECLASDGTAVIGEPAAGEVACVFDSAHPPPRTIGDPGSACLYQDLTTRFALYSGRLASVRDSVFSWQVFGGYSPLVMSLAAANDASTAPQSMVYSAQTDSLVVADGATKGLVLLGLSNLGVAAQYY